MTMRPGACPGLRSLLRIAMRYAVPPRWPLAILLLGASSVACAQVEPADVAALYEDAAMRFEERDLDAASIQLQNALRRDPNHLPSRILLARLHLRRGEGAAAEKELLIAIGAGADRDLVDALLAEAYLRQHKYAQLLAKIQPSGSDFQNQARILTLRGQAHLELARIDEAEAAFVEALGLRPDFVPAMMGRALVMMRRGRLDAAEDLADTAAAASPDDADIWYVKGEIRRYKDDREGAVANYDRAIDLAPEHLVARNARAALLFELGLDDLASADIKHVRDAQPFDPQALYLYALVQARAGDVEAAKEALQLASAALKSIAPEVLQEHAPSLLLAGMTAFLQRDFESAYGYLRSYVIRYPRHAGARTRLAAILLQRGELNEAIDVLEPALEVAPKDPNVHAMLGTAYARLGDFERASAMFEKVVELEPDRASARMQLAEAQLATGRQDEALDALSAAFALTPDSSQAGLVLASVRLSRGEYEDARRVAHDVVRREPENLTAINLLAAAEIGLKDYPAARLSLERALSIDPKFLPARINLASLERLEGHPDKARAAHLAIVEEHPDEVRSMVELARMAESEDALDDAVRWLEKVRTTDPGATVHLLHLTDLYLRLKRPADALEIARQLENRQPENLHVLAALGRSQLAAGRADLAKDTFERMSQLASFDSRQLHRISTYQVGAGDLDGARWTLQKALKGDEPDYLPAYVDHVRVLVRLGKVKEALESAEAARAAHPGLAIGERLVGEALLAAGQFGEAEQALGRAQDLSPTTAAALMIYEARRRGGDADRALGGLREWIELHPEDRAAGRALAGALVASGRFEAARAYHEELLRELPDDVGLVNDLALLYHQAGDPRALETARRARELAPERPDVLDTLGWLLVEAGEATEGLRYLREAHIRAAGVAEIRYHIAVALVRLGRNGEALKELEEAIKRGQDFPGAADARALLQRLSGN